ncbi:hypothetical protein [Nostoc sp.]
MLEKKLLDAFSLTPLDLSEILADASFIQSFLEREAFLYLELATLATT